MSRRTAGSLLIPALLLLALSCGDSNNEVRRQITSDDLASIVPSAGEVGEVLGIAEPQFEARPGDLGQEFEGIDTAAYGLAGSYAAVYGGSETEPGAGITLALFQTNEGASGAFADVVDAIEPGGDVTFDAGGGADEARGLLFPSSADEPRTTAIVMRVGNLVAFVFVINRDGDEMRDETEELAEKIINRIDELGGG